MRFEEAFALMREGEKVTRTGWQDPERHVLIYRKPYPGHQGYPVEGGLYRYDKTQVAQYTRMLHRWTPLENDLFAEDWELAK